MADSIVEKTCSRCKQTKPTSGFYRNRTSKDGLHSYCKPCLNAANARASAKARQRPIVLNRNLLRQIFSKVEVSTEKFYKGTPCWEWTSGHDQSGYGRITINGWSHSIHRVNYLLFIGDIPDGLVVDHLCRVRDCANPVHYELVTAGQNTLRGESFSAVNARKTHCPQGHPFTDDNIYPVKDGKRCLACRREQHREYARRKSQERKALPADHPINVKHREIRQKSKLKQKHKRQLEQ